MTDLRRAAKLKARALQSLNGVLMPFAKQSAFLVDYSKKSQEGQAMHSITFWVLLLFEVMKHNGLVNTSKSMRIFYPSLSHNLHQFARVA